MITVMTAALVLAILIPFREAIVDAVQNALDSVTALLAERAEAADDGERGSAVVDFVLVSVLIVTLLLAVLQVAVYVHVRNVVTASAQEGARYAANADVDPPPVRARTVEIVAGATSEQTADGLACTSAEEVDAHRADPGGRALLGRGARPARRAGQPAAAGGHRPRGQGGRVSWLRRRLAGTTRARLGAGGVRLRRAGRVRAAGLHRGRVLRGAARGVRLDRGGAGGRPGDRAPRRTR